MTDSPVLVLKHIGFMPREVFERFKAEQWTQKQLREWLGAQRK